MYVGRLIYSGPYFRGLQVETTSEMLEKFRTVKICNTTCERFDASSATIHTHFATADLAAGAWRNCQEKLFGVYKMQENAWRPGLRSPRSPS